MIQAQLDAAQQAVTFGHAGSDLHGTRHVRFGRGVIVLIVKGVAKVEVGGARVGIQLQSVLEGGEPVLRIPRSRSTVPRLP